MQIWKIERGPEPLPNGDYIVFAMVTEEEDSKDYWTEEFYFREFNDAHRFCEELRIKMEPIQLEFNFDEGLH
jgi:hypothetical protein